MKTLYIECNMGAAGDMLMAALLEICPDRETFLKKMNEMGLPGVEVSRFAAKKCGISGTGISVKINGMEEGEEHDLHEHALSHGHGGEPHHHSHEEHGHGHPEHEKPSHNHAGMGDIHTMIENLSVSDNVKSHALAVYELIAEAESSVHGTPVAEIHFHEVGNLDAVADIVGVCLLLEMLAPERIIVSPVHVGSGQVRAAHGVLPVPAPATAYILKGMPFYSGKIKGELLTPTGAALLKHFADSFSDMPVMNVEKIGYGMGKKDFEAANCVRVFWGGTEEDNEPQDKIVELSCNLDDMTPEAIGYATGILMDSGALDVFTIPIFMKKNRPACLFICLCEPERVREMALLILKNTSTNGLRITEHNRFKLEPEMDSVETSLGRVGIKTSTGYGIVKSKPEYEDVAGCAKKGGVPFETARQEALEKIRVKKISFII